jgi:hypothetical protein
LATISSLLLSLLLLLLLLYNRIEYKLKREIIFSFQSFVNNKKKINIISNSNKNQNFNLIIKKNLEKTLKKT